jgi:hypothetical protein
MVFVEVFDEAHVHRLPVQEFTGQRTGGRAVEREEMGEPREMNSGNFGRGTSVLQVICRLSRVI